MEFLKAFGIVPHDRLLKKIVATGVDLEVLVWVKGFLLGRLQGVSRADGQLFEEVRVTSGVTQGRVLGPLLLLAYVNDFGGTQSNERLFADNCIIYRKIMDNIDNDKLQNRPKHIREMSGRK
jgi:hypothetical protein